MLRLTARSGKNILGVILLVVGSILALPGMPGQGMLTILIGFALIDLPAPLVLGRRRGEVLRKGLSESG